MDAAKALLRESVALWTHEKSLVLKDALPQCYSSPFSEMLPLLSSLALGPVETRTSEGMYGTVYLPVVADWLFVKVSLMCEEGHPSGRGSALAQYRELLCECIVALLARPQLLVSESLGDDNKGDSNAQHAGMREIILKQELYVPLCTALECLDTSREGELAAGWICDRFLSDGSYPYFGSSWWDSLFFSLPGAGFAMEEEKAEDLSAVAGHVLNRNLVPNNARLRFVALYFSIFSLFSNTRESASVVRQLFDMAPEILVVSCVALCRSLVRTMSLPSAHGEGLHEESTRQTIQLQMNSLLSMVRGSLSLLHCLFIDDVTSL